MGFNPNINATTPLGCRTVPVIVSTLGDCTVNTISFSLLGQVRVILSDDNTPIILRQTCQSVLAYLLLHPEQSCTRTQLLGAFWPERSDARARRCLSTTLWRLRSALEPDGTDHETYLITTDNDRVGFNWQSAHWLDIQIFEQTLSPFLQTPVDEIQPCQAAAAESALELYRGELLEEHDYDWIVHEREHVRRLELNSLSHLMRYYRLQEDHASGLACGRRILEQDPLREEIHRAMMRLYVEQGRRVMAVRQI